MTIALEGKDIDRVKSMWTDDEMSMGEIRKALGNRYTRNQISGVIHRAKLHRTHLTPEQAEARKAPASPLAPPKGYLNQFAERPAPSAGAEPIPDPVPGITIRNCTDLTCRFPVGESGPDMPVCGHPPKAGLSYCSPHAKRAFQPQQYSASRQRQAESTAEAAV